MRRVYIQQLITQPIFELHERTNLLLSQPKLIYPICETGKGTY